MSLKYNPFHSLEDHSNNVLLKAWSRDLFPYLDSHPHSCFNHFLSQNGLKGTKLYMKNKLAVVTLSLPLILGACTSTPPAAPEHDGTDASLSEASYYVSRSISSLSETAQAARPLPPLDPPPNPASYGMGGLTSVDWSGPVEPLIRQIAKVTNYRVRVLGRPPAIPVLVSVYDKNMMVADILRDVGFQCGRRATVVVYPESRVIELRYAKN